MRGAIVFVDGTQVVGAMSITADLPSIDVLAVPNHKYLLNAGRGARYCHLSPAMQDRFRPVTPGWKAGRVPYESFFGPTMGLAPTASRFDNSLSWLAAFGDDAAFCVFDDFGPEAMYARNRELAEYLRGALADIGLAVPRLPEANRSTIVAVPLGDLESGQLLSDLKSQGVACAIRDGNLRVAVHFYNHEDGVACLVSTLPH